MYIHPAYILGPCVYVYLGRYVGFLILLSIKVVVACYLRLKNEFKLPTYLKFSITWYYFSFCYQNIFIGKPKSLLKLNTVNFGKLIS